MLTAMTSLIDSQRTNLDRGLPTANSRYAIGHPTPLSSLMHIECMLSVDSDPSKANHGKGAITAIERAVSWPETHTVRAPQALSPAGKEAYALLLEESDRTRKKPMLVSRFDSTKVNRRQYLWVKDHEKTIGWAFDLPEMLRLVLHAEACVGHPQRTAWNGIGVSSMTKQIAHEMRMPTMHVVMHQLLNDQSSDFRYVLCDVHAPSM